MSVPTWTKIPVIPCSQSKKDYRFGNYMLTQIPYGVCMDWTGIVAKTYESGMITQINISLYRCIETPENIAARITKCKNDIPTNKLFFFSFALEKSFNLNDYKNPVSYNFENVGG